MSKLLIGWAEESIVPERPVLFSCELSCLIVAN